MPVDAITAADETTALAPPPAPITPPPTPATAPPFPVTLALVVLLELLMRRFSSFGSRK